MNVDANGRLVWPRSRFPENGFDIVMIHGLQGYKAMKSLKERRSGKDRRKIKYSTPFPLRDHKKHRIEKERRVIFDRRAEKLELSAADMLSEGFDERFERAQENQMGGNTSG